jgi:hypothetical protein
MLPSTRQKRTPNDLRQNNRKSKTGTTEIIFRREDPGAKVPFLTLALKIFMQKLHFDQCFEKAINGEEKNHFYCFMYVM